MAFRAFIAIELPEAVLEQARAVQEGLRRAGWERRLGPGARAIWVRPEAMHLTLRFLGTIAENQAGPIGEAMERAAMGVAPFGLSLAALGGAPSLSAPRVLWLDLKDPGPLQGLYRALSQELQKAGIAPDERPYTPHLTLARVKGARVKGGAPRRGPCVTRCHRSGARWSAGR